MAASTEQSEAGDMSEIFTKYEKARKLSEEDSKADPETEPYKSKYEAREILVELKTMIQALLNENEHNEDVQYQLNALECLLASNYIETDETSSGEEHLNKCLSALQSEKLNQKCVSIVLSTLNQYGILWCARSDFDKALHYLQESESLYAQYLHEVGKAPYSIHELFRSEDDRLSEHDRQAKFEQIHTLTLYFLAQVHGKLDHKDKSAMYCHTTLQRQLETNQYDPVDWATNCATLSQYYLTNDNYNQARHCLASASKVFEEAYEKYIEEGTSRESEDTGVDDPLPLRKADIARCWTKYCIALLTLSKDTLLRQYQMDEDTEGQDQEGEQSEGDAQGACGETQKNSESLEENSEENGEEKETDTNESKNGGDKLELRFESLELTAYENQVTDKLVKTYEMARDVFRNGQKWILESKEHYVLDGFVSDNISIIQDYSILFKLLAFFERDLERRCKMHKRRIDMLQKILTDLNQQHFLMYCRQLQFEMADIYSEMVDLKISITEREDRVTPYAISKINTLIGQSLKMLQMFVDTLRSPDGKMPEKIEEDMLRPTLIANFCMGRLYSKYIEPDVNKKVDYILKSTDKYHFVVDYCDRYPETINIIKAEHELCREMVTLLPVKLQQLRPSASSHS
ncbi:KIF-binding protein-like [Ptychodera flava]|uniref:KIF-binding protein-like n=1 Tax=Ptychodera flava TaxID=63121 RepID=UPI00396A6D57